LDERALGIQFLRLRQHGGTQIDTGDVELPLPVQDVLPSPAPVADRHLDPLQACAQPGLRCLDAFIEVVLQDAERLFERIETQLFERMVAVGLRVPQVVNDFLAAVPAFLQEPGELLLDAAEVRRITGSTYSDEAIHQGRPIKWSFDNGQVIFCRIMVLSLSFVIPAVDR
jgi:hypothetical protein